MRYDMGRRSRLPCNGCCKSCLWKGERNICSPTGAEKLGFEARKKTLVYIVGVQDGHGEVARICFEGTGYS